MTLVLSTDRYRRHGETTEKPYSNIYIQQDATLHSLFYLETALHFSGGAVDTVVCAPDDGWWYHPKHVEQFPDKINCVTLHLVGYVLEYNYGARTHER